MDSKYAVLGVYLGKIKDAPKKEQVHIESLATRLQLCMPASTEADQVDQAKVDALTQTLERFTVPDTLPPELASDEGGLRKIRPEHQIALDLYCEGIPLKKIAEVLGRTYNTVIRLVNTPLFRHAVKHRLAVQSAEIHDQIVLAQEAALAQVKKLAANGKSEAIQLRASQWLLEVGGVSPVQKSVSASADFGSIMEQAMKIAEEQRKRDEQAEQVIVVN